MKKEQIRELFRQFENICYLYNGIECWSARELQQLLGYSKWDNFADIGKMVEIGSGSKREILDMALTR